MSTQVSGPMPEASEVGPVESAATDRAVTHGGKVVECFDATAATVFASLCRVTVGDRAASERLLTETYAQLQRGPARTIDLAALISLAHRDYLADSATMTTRPTVVQHDDSTWSAATWRGLAPDAVAALTPQQRAALNLFAVEGFPVTDVAECLAVPVDEAQRLIVDGRRALTQAGVGDSLPELFRQCEIWLDDSTRDRIRDRLVERRGRTQESGGAAGQAGAPTNSRARLAIGLVAVLIVSAAAARWIGTSPEQNGAPIKFAVPSTVGGSTDSTAPQAVESGEPGQQSLQIVVGAPQDAKTADLPWSSVPGSRGDAMVVLAPELTDLQTVMPDAIVRYSNGKIGLSWRGPCNRPAATVQFSDLPQATGLQLTTGSFTVVACTGMPDRWTAVVDPPVSLSDGPVLPVVNGVLDASFAGESDMTASNDPRTLVADARAGYGSALVDAGNNAWVYVNGCQNIDAIRYQSPVGPIFEVQTPDADRTYCVAPDPPQRLRGPVDRQFPQPAVAQSQGPIDCRGPYGSLTDVAPEPPFTSKFQDGAWSTWDGCRVRSNVIFSRAYDDCGLPTVRTITFATNLGGTILNERSQTYLDDPNGLVPGDHASTLTVPGLPGDATDTGLRHGDEQLWTSPESPPVIYVVSADTIERWPLIADPPSCG